MPFLVNDFFVFNSYYFIIIQFFAVRFFWEMANLTLYEMHFEINSQINSVYGSQHLETRKAK